MQVIDSHTAGEPTRVILSGAPELGGGSVAERAARLRHQYPDFYRAVISEPRGYDAVVGALLLEPSAADCATGVIYFNSVGNLGMCGHATIGLAATLAHLGRIDIGLHRFETPVGIVSVELLDQHSVKVGNIESYRYRKAVQLEVADLGIVTGDIAWGGNWFFLTADTPVPLTYTNIPHLTAASLKIRKALINQQITGKNGAEIDHIEFIGSPHHPAHHGRNFVLCPNGAYDRSPCGTGSSAKLACLAADGKLMPGEEWIQESIIDSTYSLRYHQGEQGGIIPTICGQAFVISRAELLFHSRDPYRTGIHPSYC